MEAVLWLSGIGCHLDVKPVTQGAVMWVEFAGHHANWMRFRRLASRTDLEHQPLTVPRHLPGDDNAGLSVPALHHAVGKRARLPVNGRQKDVSGKSPAAIHSS